MTSAVILSIETVEKLKKQKKVTMEFNPLANQGRGSQPRLLPLGKQPGMELKTLVHKSGSSVWQQTSLPSDPLTAFGSEERFSTSKGGKSSPLLFQKA